jgi:hypothetical protein
MFDTENNPLANLVGEDKKYKTLDDLVKAVGEKDRFIDQLKTENAGMRSDLSIWQEKANKQPEQPQGQSETPKAPELPSEDVLFDAVRKIQEKLSKEEREQQNVNQVTERLIKEFGSSEKGKEWLVNKAQELGVSVQFLNDAAAVSPAAFYNAVGLTDNAKGASFSAGTVRTNINLNPSAVTPGTRAFYDQMRKENPSKYWSPQVQGEIHRIAVKAGSYDF